MITLFIGIDTIISSSFFQFSIIIIGALWVYHKFSTEENKAGLSIQFKKINLSNNKNNKFNINIDVNVKNVGNRQLSIILKKTYLKVYSIEESENKDDNLIFIKEYRGRSSHKHSGNEMRIRPNVGNNFSYLITLMKPGNYMFEFHLVSNLDRYRSHLSYVIAKIFRQPTKLLNKIFRLFKSKKTMNYRDVRIVVWKEKAFYNIE